MTLSPPAVAEVCRELSALGERTRIDGPWRSGAFAAMARHGLLAAFIPADCGGNEAAETEVLAMLVEVSRSCLTTALALTQWASGCRLISAGSDEVRRQYLPPLGRGETLTTVGISQLTTSRRHLASPVLSATLEDDGWRLSGLCPWVTGGDSSDTIVTGAAVAVGDGIVTRFFIVPREAEGVRVDPPMELLGLSGSRTSAVRFDRASASESIELDGGRGVRSGGLATTALAIGSAKRSIELLRELAREGDGRPEIERVADGLSTECEAAFYRMTHLAARHPSAGDVADRDGVRTEATHLAIRSAQASLVASKGAGYMVGHPAERAIRESMFFLVWSCPQAVASAVMCELAGLSP
jgi:alkylation response protein AidB-like acyl-CoA dehydrogenase